MFGHLLTLYDTSARWRRKWHHEARYGRFSTRYRLPCIHETNQILSPCDRGDEERHIRRCELHGPCIRKMGRAAAATLCQTCPDFMPPETDHPRPKWELIKRFDQKNLFPGHPRSRFNGSITRWGEGYALAWRDGWAGSDIWCTYLDRQFIPQGGSTKLHLQHSRCSWGREDPRWFSFRGRPHIMFVGVERVSGQDVTSVLYARVNDQFEVEETFYPEIPGRANWEKNHAYFEREGQLYAIYSTNPYRILAIDGNRAEFVHQSPCLFDFSLDRESNGAGEIRGGASPVLVGNEWWHFFHSRIETRRGRQYCMGLYTFQNQPPFPITRMVYYPIQWADWTLKPTDQYCADVFPCGALRDGDRWIISQGVHDRFVDLVMFQHADLELLLNSRSRII